MKKRIFKQSTWAILGFTCAPTCQYEAPKHAVAGYTPTYFVKCLDKIFDVLSELLNQTPAHPNNAETTPKTS